MLTDTPQPIAESGSGSPVAGSASAGSSPSAALVGALRRGEAGAAEALLREFGPALMAIGRSVLGHEADALDAVQDGLLGALRGLDGLRDPEALAGWLKRAVTNAALARLRSRKRRRERSMDELLPTFDPDGHRAGVRPTWSAEAPDPSRAETRRLVRAAIEELPASYREVVVLRDLLGLDGAEAAAVLGVTTTAVKVRLHRARQALRTILEVQLGGDVDA